MLNQEVYDRHYNAIKLLTSKLTALRITIYELLYILSFAVNFVVGKTLHVFSLKEEVYNYYNDKGNVFNQVFVKKGWGWTTLVITIFYAIRVVKSERKVPLVVGAILRWLVATFWWVLFTQWCFGLPIMDKVFLWTGGKCANIAGDRIASLAFVQLVSQLVEEAFYESTQISSSTCRRLRGTWEGGHDPLGHVFLLVHSSLYLFHEIQTSWPGWLNLMARLRSSRARGGVVATVLDTPSLVVVWLLAMWWFMLLMTNMYFHSLAEKIMGLLAGYLGVFAVYYVPRYVGKKKH